MEQNTVFIGYFLHKEAFHLRCGDVLWTVMCEFIVSYAYAMLCDPSTGSG